METQNLNELLNPVEQDLVKASTQSQLNFQQAQNLPKKVVITKTDDGHSFKMPDTSLDWTRNEFKKIDQAYEINPVLGGVAEFGFGAVSSFAALAKPVAGWTMEKLGYKTRDTHYVSPADAVFEPIGWSPKGSTEILKSRPIFSAGGIAGEYLQSVGIGYAAKTTKSAIKTGIKLAPTKTFKAIKTISTKTGIGDDVVKQLQKSDITQNIGRWSKGKTLTNPTPRESLRTMWYKTKSKVGWMTEIKPEQLMDEAVLSGKKKFATLPKNTLSETPGKKLLENTRMFESTRGFADDLFKLGSDDIVSIHTTAYKQSSITYLKKGSSETAARSIGPAGKGSPRFLHIGMSAEPKFKLPSGVTFSRRLKNVPTTVVTPIKKVVMPPSKYLTKKGWSSSDELYRSFSKWMKGNVKFNEAVAAPKLALGGGEYEALIPAGRTLVGGKPKFFTMINNRAVPIVKRTGLKQKFSEFLGGYDDVAEEFTKRVFDEDLVKITDDLPHVKASSYFDDIENMVSIPSSYKNIKMFQVSSMLTSNQFSDLYSKQSIPSSVGSITPSSSNTLDTSITSRVSSTNNLVSTSSPFSSSTLTSTSSPFNTPSSTPSKISTSKTKTPLIPSKPLSSSSTTSASSPTIPFKPVTVKPPSYSNYEPEKKKQRVGSPIDMNKMGRFRAVKIPDPFKNKKLLGGIF